MSSSLGIHFTSFLFVFPIGIRRLLSASSLYLDSNPSQFRSRMWYFSNPRWKNIDFFALLISLPIASFSHFFLFLAFSGHPTYKFGFLQQSFVVFIFWVLLILISVKDNVDTHMLPENFVFIFAGVSFVIEYLLNGKGIIGVGEVGYGLLGGLVLVCAACCLYLSLRPGAFFAEFLLSTGLVLKGTWVLQVGLSLYTDTFGFKGCDKVSAFSSQGKTDVRCPLDEDRLTGMALMNLLFIVHVIVVLMVSLLLFGFVRHRQNVRSSSANGSLLAQLETNSMMMQPLPEFYIE